MNLSDKQFERLIKRLADYRRGLDSAEELNTPDGEYKRLKVTTASTTYYTFACTLNDLEIFDLVQNEALSRGLIKTKKGSHVKY